MSRLEKTTDLIVFNILRSLNYVDGNFDSIDHNINVWAKKSSNPEIDSILSTSSKKRTNQKGYPEYIIYDDQESILIVIENKKDVKKHIFNDIDSKVDEYAVNGALWYAEKLKVKFDVIAIGISGNSIEELKIDTYAWKKNADSFSNLNLHEVKNINSYRDILKKVTVLEHSEDGLLELNNEAQDINNFLRDYLGVIEHERLYVLGSILFALEDPIFRMSYAQVNNDSDLSVFIYQTIERKVKGASLQNKDIIINELKSVLLSLKTAEKEKVREIFPNGVLLELVKKVDNVLFDYHKNSQLDMISTFFNVFLSYSTSGGSDLGIVLTPPHITKLFSDIANINLSSKILDICAGTGGFLTTAWKKIILNPNYSYTEKEQFRKNNIYGVEKEKSVFTIIALNMFLNRDGRSNLFHGDCFSLKDKLKQYECNVAFLNPPYSDSVYSEISFVELALDVLLPNSIGVAIIPINAVSSRTKKHSNITAVKKRLLQKHDLLASIQMPSNLFYPKGTETIILVFKTGVSNHGTTWFAKFDDGYELIKHQKSRTPSKKSKEKYNLFLNTYRSFNETSFSFNKLINEEDQWVYTVLKDEEYSIDLSDLQETVNEYISYLYLNLYK